MHGLSSSGEYMKRLILFSTLIALIVVLLFLTPTHAQLYPQSFELTCQVGSSPISGPTGVSWNPTTGKYRANFCIDANGNLTQNSGANTIYGTVSPSTNANINTTTMATAGPSGNTYRFAIYQDQTVLGAGCSTNTTVTVTLAWTDPNGSAPTSLGASAWTLTIVNNGVLNTTNNSGGSGNTTVIRAKASTAVQYSTTYTQGTCTTGPSYQSYPILEVLQ